MYIYWMLWTFQKKICIKGSACVHKNALKYEIQLKLFMNGFLFINLD